MNSLKHVLLNSVLGFIYLNFIRAEWNWGIFIIIVLFGGILIDFDHLLNDLMSRRVEKPYKLLKYWEYICDKHTGEIYVFHVIELWAIIFILSFRYEVLFYFFLAWLFHFIADAITSTYHQKNFEWIYDYSIISALISDRKPKLLHFKFWKEKIKKKL